MCTETRRILLIHSNDAIAELIELCLETAIDCKVIAVNYSIEAIETASTERIDVILLDLDETIPDLNWCETVRKLKQNHLTGRIPLILLTTTPQSRELLQFQQTKNIEAVPKSFDLLNLASQVAVLLNWNDN